MNRWLLLCHYDAHTTQQNTRTIYCLNSGGVTLGFGDGDHRSISNQRVAGTLRRKVLKMSQEIGIRMALGATRGKVQGMVLRDGMRMAGAGVAIGLAAALVLIRLLRGVLVGLGSGDAATVAGAVVLVSATAVIACLVPARWATRVDPMVALRHE